MRYAEKRNLPSGFTLVEIMVAMLITLIVMGGVYRTLTDESVNQERSEKILDMQNNARVALERIARDVRRTGSLGCGGTWAASTLMNPTIRTDPPDPTNYVSRYTVADDLLDPPGLIWSGGESILKVLRDLALAGTNVNFLNEIMGFYNNAWSGHDLYQDGTDAISLVFLSEERALVPTIGVPLPVDSFEIDAPGFSREDILYVTDCQGFSLTQVTNDPSAAVLPPFIVDHEPSQGINTVNVNLERDYGADGAPTRVSKLNISTYFIHKNGNFDLCLNTTSRAIASNIEDLQFEFLADEDNDGNLAEHPWRTDLTAYPISSDDPIGAGAVRAVRIWVLAMSEPDYGFIDTDTYVYPNSPYAVNSPADLAPIASPTDGENRHRYLASAVVYLRNAGL